MSLSTLHSGLCVSPKSLHIMLIFGRVSLEEGVRERADRVRLDDLGVVVPYGPRVVFVLLVGARASPDLEGNVEFRSRFLYTSSV